MNLEQLNIIWNSFSENNKTSDFEYKLISTDTVPLLNIGITLNSDRCLVLEIPMSSNFVFSEALKEHIELRYFKAENCLCIILKDRIYNDLFDDFILSMFFKIKNLEDPNEYCKLFVQYFYKWSSFFEKKQTNLLSKEVIQGIFGELIFLKHLISNNTEAPINDLLNTWTGLKGTCHDFILESIDYEVKTILSHINHVKISSEYQLDISNGKNLELVVVEVIEDNVDGKNISLLVNELRNNVIELFGDYFNIVSSLNDKGLTLENLKLYDSWKYTLQKISFYDCTKSNFPKIIKSNLSEELFNLKYCIRISLIQEYLINEIV